MSWWDDVDFLWSEFMRRLIEPTLSNVGHGAAYSANTKAHSFDRINNTVTNILQDQNSAPAKNTPSPASSGPTPNPSSSGPTPAASPKPSGAGDSMNQAVNSTVNALLPIFQAQQRQSQGDILGVNPNAPVFNPRTKKTQVGDKTEFAPKITKIETEPLQDIIKDAFAWDDKKFAQVVKLMQDAGYIGPNEIPDRMTVAAKWQRLAASSALLYEQGHKISPMELLKRASFGQGGSIGPKTTTNTSTNYLQTNATTARALAMEALSQRLGRRATDQEVSEFAKELHAAEQKNPTTQTTTTTTSADGKTSSSTSKTKQGLDVADFAKQYMLDYNTEEAKAIQSYRHFSYLPGVETHFPAPQTIHLCPCKDESS
jgi:hypothetical protein